VLEGNDNDAYLLMWIANCASMLSDSSICNKIMKDRDAAIRKFLVECTKNINVEYIVKEDIISKQRFVTKGVRYIDTDDDDDNDDDNNNHDDDASDDDASDDDASDDDASDDDASDDEIVREEKNNTIKKKLNELLKESDDGKFLFKRYGLNILVKYLKSIYNDEGSVYDEVVNYGMKELYQKLDDADKRCIHLCDCNYFMQVQNKDSTYSPKNSNFSNFKYIYVPIHINGHFSLVCIVQIFVQLESQRSQSSKEPKKVYALHFDSISKYHQDSLTASTINR
jgi:hypothetical protein